MFLRYLAAEGRCRPGLEQALISPACWAKQALPRGLSSQEVQKILDRLPATPAGIRDRAMLLLMIRLGLRASDVAAMRLGDLCFRTATLRVSGKGRREVRLPLPQDVGDSILDYLRSGRPESRCEQLFLRLPASFPAAERRGVGRRGAQWAARSALNRGGIERPTRGSHVLRHTAACQMLRAGVNLEGIAEVLRHRSVETTGIYAKVDVAALMEIAQPWPEVAPC
ncbi:MAG: tyrosine-type recombinase/integrase, partial [Chloroflexi bacterium]|nr:tyrosine-type recombinase/integrase [Chloroflexota bacterium]